MAMKGINLTRGYGSNFGFGSSEVFHHQAWLLFVLWALSPYSVENAAAAQVCTTNAEGKTVCHDKLSGGIIAAIVITILLVLLMCAGIYYIIRRTRAHITSTNAAHPPNSSWLSRQLPSLGFSARGRRDEEEGDDDDKYLSVEKNQIHGPTWEARYDPSSAPLPGKRSSSWSARLRYGMRSGGSSGSGGSGGSRRSDYDNQPMSAPGWSHGSRNEPSSRQKPRSAGAEHSLSSHSTMTHSSSGSSGGKRHWGSLIHGSPPQHGSRSAGMVEAPMKVHAPGRTRPSPGLHIIAQGPGHHNAQVMQGPLTPKTPYTPKTPSRLGAAPPLSAGPGFSSAPMAPRTPRTPLTARGLPTAVPAPTYSPRAPVGHMGAI